MLFGKRIHFTKFVTANKGGKTTLQALGSPCRPVSGEMKGWNLLTPLLVAVMTVWLEAMLKEWLAAAMTARLAAVMTVWLEAMVTAWLATMMTVRLEVIGLQSCFEMIPEFIMRNFRDRFGFGKGSVDVAT